VSLGNKENYKYTVRRESISKSCEITQADNLNRRRRLSRKAQCARGLPSYILRTGSGWTDGRDV